MTLRSVFACPYVSKKRAPVVGHNDQGQMLSSELRAISPLRLQDDNFRRNSDQRVGIFREPPATLPSPRVQAAGIHPAFTPLCVMTIASDFGFARAKRQGRAWARRAQRHNVTHSTQESTP